MIPQSELQKIANKKKVRDKQIEKDYVLSWILYGVSSNSFLKKNLVFKGGTALKKFYFQDYRFSEDLDFTLVDSKIQSEKLLDNFKQTFQVIKQKSNISLEIKNDEMNKHGDLRFFIDYIGPLQAGLGSRDVKVDITYNEVLINKTLMGTMFREYTDLEQISVELPVYPLEEIFIEKLCALIDRTQPRDFYDLWYLLENTDLDIKENWADFLQKANSKQITNPDISQTLTNKEKTFERMWNQSLAHQIQDLPYFEEVMRSMKRYFR